MIKKILFLFLISVSSVSTTFSQVDAFDEKPTDDYEFDVRLLKHYSVDELRDLSQNYPDDYSKIVYFHLSSYELVVTDSSLPEFSLFNAAEFDVSLYETRRSLNQYVELDFSKYGVKIILIPYAELESLTPQQELYKNELEN